MSIHRTATGKFLDINALKIQQEHAIAVGNARQNARGDLLGNGGQIVKTRDEIMNEYYKSQQGNKLMDNPIYSNADEANQSLVADIFETPIANGYDQIEQSLIEPTVVNPKTGAATSGGYADALVRSQELAEKMKAQRSRI
jgi:hypothetical protein